MNSKVIGVLRLCVNLVVNSFFLHSCGRELILTIHRRINHRSLLGAISGILDNNYLTR